MFNIIFKIKKIYSGNDYSFLNGFLIIKLLKSIQQNFLKKNNINNKIIVRFVYNLFIILII